MSWRLCQLTSLSRCCSMAAASSAAQGMSGSPAAKIPSARWAYLAAHAKAHKPSLKQQNCGSMSMVRCRHFIQGEKNRATCVHCPKGRRSSHAGMQKQKPCSLLSGFSHHCTEYVDMQCKHRSRALLRAHLNMETCGADLLQLHMKCSTMLGPPSRTKCAAHASLSWTQCATSATTDSACSQHLTIHQSLSWPCFLIGAHLPDCPHGWTMHEQSHQMSKQHPMMFSLQ